MSFFERSDPIPLEGADSRNPLAYRFYDPDARVLGRRMEDQLRFAVCYWHSFVWPGTDPFGGETFEREWFSGEPMDAAKRKADVAFELFRLLGVPFFTFHDRDVAPEGATLTETSRRLDEMAEILADKMEETGVKLLWGTANLFSHRRYMGGAATNPDPDVFAYASAQVAHAMAVTHRLGGENYVLWGGREGYETLLNTDMKRELDQMGRFLQLVVEHKHAIGFDGAILVEPKPQEPTKHQYDHDVATIYGFLKAHDLENEVRVNIEQNHAILAGHSFEHEIATARALGLFGSIDINRGDYQSGWDTDQFAMNVPELALACFEIFRDGGGFTSGGMNFDAKIRRQSIDPADLLHAHVGSIDAVARALLVAERMIEEGELDRLRAERYAGWEEAGAERMLSSMSLRQIADEAERNGIDPRPRSGRQEYLEGLVNRYF